MLELMREWARTPQRLLKAGSADLLHGKRNRAVWGEDRQKQFQRVGWTNDSCLSAGILIRLDVFLLTP